MPTHKVRSGCLQQPGEHTCQYRSQAIDLDRFKEVNDSFGHPMGDILLRMVGPRLASVVREGDVVARLGGDEFGVVLADADRTYASEIASRLRTELRRPFDLEGLSVTLDASIGIALCPHHGDGTDVLLQRGACQILCVSA